MLNQKRRDLVCARLAQMPRLSYLTPESGMFIMVNISAFFKDDKELARCRKAVGITRQCLWCGHDGAYSAFQPEDVLSEGCPDLIRYFLDYYIEVLATCGEVLVKILQNYGIDTIFGIPGVHTVELYRGLEEVSINHVTEHVDGYSIPISSVNRTYQLGLGPSLLYSRRPESYRWFGFLSRGEIYVWYRVWRNRLRLFLRRWGSVNSCLTALKIIYWLHSLF